MILSHAITMALDALQEIPEIQAVQSDQYCRQLVLTLTAQGQPFQIPDGTTVKVRFRRGDGSGEEYATLPNGRICWSYTENVLTVALAPQVCTQAGSVQLTVQLTYQQALLHSFPIRVLVLPDSEADFYVESSPVEILLNAEEVSF